MNLTKADMDNHRTLMAGIAKRKIDLFIETGHELLQPANQYCKHCGYAMFGRLSRDICTGKKLPDPNEEMRNTLALVLGFVFFAIGASFALS